MHTLKIKNVRCYDNKEISFRRGMNVLIGDNSVGKTSLLRACTLAMNAYFAGYSEKYTRWESANNKDFRFWYNQDGLKQISSNMEIEFDLLDSDLHPIKFSHSQSVFPISLNTSFKIEKKSKKNANPLKTGIKSLISYCKSLKENSHVNTESGLVQMNALPVYAVFSTDDIHSQTRKFDKTGFKEELQIPSFGYFKCNDTRSLFGLWIKRMLVLAETNTYTEIVNVESALLSAFGENGCNILKEIKIFINKKVVAFVQSDGKVVDFDYLSDGYCRLFNIVIDIAFRCALLNKGIYGNEAYKKTHGTVIIDEIDEHLHPELQVRILKALHDTFPKIQFIVSTHAPLVMSSVENNDDNVVYRLEYKDGEYTHTELNTYGLDASTIMEVYMCQSARDVEINDKINEIRILIDEEKMTEAKEKLHALQEQTGSNDPEFSQLETMIAFLED